MSNTTTTTPEPTVVELDPPHKPRDSWDHHCPYCDARPGQPCRTLFGRPYVWDPERGKHVTMTRVSGLAKTNGDGTALVAWKQRMVAVGLLQRTGLMTKLAGIVAKAQGDLDAAKQDINGICSDALNAAGGGDKADAGTGFHSLAEALNSGYPLEFVPEADRARVEAYRQATKHLTSVSREVFVVNDELGTAGSFDDEWLCPDGRVRVGDLKSGKWEAAYPTGVATQMAIYAHSKRYDVRTGARLPLHPDLDPFTGLLIHLPAPQGDKPPTCEVIPLDLRKGWYNARLAAAVRDVRAWDAADLKVEVPW